MGVGVQWEINWSSKFLALAQKFLMLMYIFSFQVLWQQAKSSRSVAQGAGYAWNLNVIFCSRAGSVVERYH